MIERLVILGATGDLAGRYLFPALAALHGAARLPESFGVIGVGRADLGDEAFRQQIADGLDQHAPDLALASREALLGSITYRGAELADSAAVAGVVGADARGRAVAAYLALPPSLFAGVVTSFDAASPPDGSRIAIEKPFGNDLAEARALNELVHATFGDAAEQIVFRVDHVLGMATTQNLIGLRVNNPVLDAMWTGNHIERVDILWEEVLGLEGRAGYFDTAGALKDVMQNHMLQVLALVAMEPPASLGERDLRDAKVRALQAVRSPTADSMRRDTRRARYTAGELPPQGAAEPLREVPAYVDEPGVDPERGTETWAEMSVEVDTPRWSGTRFVLRGGKALARRRKGVMIHFQPGQPLGSPAKVVDGGAGTLWIGIDLPNDITLRLVGMSAAAPFEPEVMALSAPPPDPQLPPYANVLLDLLGGDSRLAVRGDEAEAAWAIVTPVLEAWASGTVPMEEYPAGSSGPAPRD